MNASVTLLALTVVSLVAAVYIPSASGLFIVCAVFTGFFTLLSAGSK